MISDSHQIGPRGARLKERFHALQPQETLKREDGQLTKVGKDGSQVQLPSPDPSLLPPSAPQVGPGWVEYGSWTDSGSQRILSFSGNWKVPQPPSVEDGQVIFLSMGLQTSESSSDDLFLPVLQWGPSAAGGGNYWAVSCWYQHVGRTVFSTLLRVEPGDTIFGTIARTVHNKFGTQWNCTAKVEGSTSASTTIPVIGDITVAWAFTALEAYSKTIACEQFPASGVTDFVQLALASETSPLTPAWTPTVDFAQCNNQVNVLSPAEIRLIYG